MQKYTNYNQIKNAITFICLAGTIHEDKRREVFQLIDYYHRGDTNRADSQAHAEMEAENGNAVGLKGAVNQFVLMFYKSKVLAFKGIYCVDQRVGSTAGSIRKVYGKGPAVLQHGEGSADAIQEFLKFETSSKSFKTLPVTAFSSSVDAVILEFKKGTSGKQAVG